MLNPTKCISMKPLRISTFFVNFFIVSTIMVAFVSNSRSTGQPVIQAPYLKVSSPHGTLEDRLNKEAGHLIRKSIEVQHSLVTDENHINFLINGRTEEFDLSHRSVIMFFPYYAGLSHFTVLGRAWYPRSKYSQSPRKQLHYKIDISFDSVQNKWSNKIQIHDHEVPPVHSLLIDRALGIEKDHELHSEWMRQIVQMKLLHLSNHFEWFKYPATARLGVLPLTEFYELAGKIIDETEGAAPEAPDYDHDMVLCGRSTPKFKYGCTMAEAIKIKSFKLEDPHNSRSRSTTEMIDPESKQIRSKYDLFRGWVPYLTFESYWNDEDLCWPGQLTHNNMKIYIGNTELGHLTAGLEHHKFSLENISSKDMWTEQSPDESTRLIAKLKIDDTSADQLPEQMPINSRCGVWIRKVSIGHDLENVVHDMTIARSLVSEKLENMGLRMVLHGHYSRRRSASTCLIHSLGERYLSRSSKGDSSGLHSDNCANTDGLVNDSGFHEKMMLNSAIKQGQDLGIIDKNINSNDGIQSYLQIRDVLNQKCKTFTHSPISDFTTGENWLRNLIQWRGNNDALTENLIAFNQTYFDILELQRYGRSLMNGTTELSESERVKFNTEQNLSWLYSTPPTIEELTNE